MSSTLRNEFGQSPDGRGDWVVAISDLSEWGDYRMEEWAAIRSYGKPALPFFGPLSECPSEILDREFDTGFGSPSRPLYTVWTTNYIITCTEYDGSTGVEWTNRNPVPYRTERS